LRRLWQQPDGPASRSLVGMARKAGGGDNLETLLPQIPHWMFTFSGSGSDLLWRGLAMMGSRPQVLARARAEIAEAGALDDPAAIERLRYVEACLLESARLYPPVKATFHRAPEGDLAVSPQIPGGTELVQVFALTQRDRRSDPTADDFQPERWLGPSSRAEAIYPNLFLSGARRCPGRDLILFVCKAAAAHVLGESGVVVGSERLARDPVSFSFPAKQIRTS
jgi:cytochrome P450